MSFQGQEATLNPGPPGAGQCLSAPEPGTLAGRDKKVGSFPALGALVPGPAAPCTGSGALNGKLPAWCSQYIYLCLEHLPHPFSHDGEDQCDPSFTDEETKAPRGCLSQSKCSP